MEQVIARLETIIRVLGIVITIGRYLRLIIGVSVLLTIALVAYSFAVGNFAGAIVSGLFAFGGIVLLFQLRHTRKGRYRRMPSRHKQAESNYRATHA